MAPINLHRTTRTTHPSTISAKDTPMTIKFTPTETSVTFRVPITLHRADLPLAIAGWALDVNESDQTQAILSIANPDLAEIEGWTRNAMADFGREWVTVAAKLVPETLSDLAAAMVDRLFPTTDKATVNDPAKPPGKTKVVNLVPDPDADTESGKAEEA